MDFTNFTKVMNFISESLNLMEGLDRFEWMSAICMVLEEKCKADGLDMVETCKRIYDSAVQVNEELGKY